MWVKQISIFLENKSGRLAAVTRLLADHGFNIRALSIADTSDFGILRLIVNDPARAYQVLKDAGFTVSETEVLAVEMPDRPGGLAGVLDLLNEAGINIEYLYAFVSKSAENALVLLKVENLEKAAGVLTANGVTIQGHNIVHQI
jgi:hypothetical protein